MEEESVGSSYGYSSILNIPGVAKTRAPIYIYIYIYI